MTSDTPLSRVAEWAALVGASVPDGVDEEARSPSDPSTGDSA